MSTTIVTSTASTATGIGAGRRVDRCQNGVLWAFPNVTATSWRPQFSTDNGATWTQDTAQTGVINASVFIDLDDFCHVAWRQSGTTGPNGATLVSGAIYYMRGTPNAGRTAWTWSTAVLVVTTGTTPDTPDIVAHREGTGWAAHIVYGSLTGGPSTNVAAHYGRINITSGGVMTLTAPVVISSTATTVAAPQPSIDFNHTGDGKTVAGSTPHLYAGWALRTPDGVFFRKAVYSAGSWTWNAERSLDTGRSFTTSAWVVCQFDGTRASVVGTLSAGANTDTVVYDRDAADTTTTTTVLLTGTTAANFLLVGSATYDSAGNIYIFGRDGSGASGTRQVNYRKWTRSGASLGAIVTLDTTGPDNPYISAKRAWNNSRIELVRTDNTVTPFNVVYDAVVLNVAPNAPTGLGPTGGATIDRTITQRFSWVFSDPDAGDTQSNADLRYRLVGAGTWTDVLAAATTNQFYDFAPNALAAGNYEWQVRTSDSSALAGPYSASSFFTAASPPAAPTITAPVSGATIPANSTTVTWSSGAKIAYQVRTVADAAGVADPGTIYTDSGTVVDSTATTRTVTFAVNGRTEHIQVRIQSTGGLWSTWADSRNPISFTPPATPTVIVTSSTLTGTLSVAYTNPTPTGGQPAVTSNDIYRREVKGGVPQTATEKRIAIGVSTPWVDWYVASRRDYQYKTRATAANGTYSDSAWT